MELGILACTASVYGTIDNGPARGGGSSQRVERPNLWWPISALHCGTLPTPTRSGRSRAESGRSRAESGRCSVESGRSSAESGRGKAESNTVWPLSALLRPVPTLFGRLPLYCGRSPIYCSSLPLYCGRSPIYCDRSPIYMFSGHSPLYCGRSPNYRGHFQLYCGRFLLYCGCSWSVSDSVPHLWAAILINIHKSWLYYAARTNFRTCCRCRGNINSRCAINSRAYASLPCGPDA